VNRNVIGAAAVVCVKGFALVQSDDDTMLSFQSDGMQPVFQGDGVKCYSNWYKAGNTSIHCGMRISAMMISSRDD